jgi:hypothetical protein
VPAGFRGRRTVMLRREGDNGTGVSTQVETHTARGAKNMRFAVSRPKAVLKELIWSNNPAAALARFGADEKVTNADMLKGAAKGWFFFGFQSKELQEVIEEARNKAANQPQAEAAKRQRFNRVSVKAAAECCDDADVAGEAELFAYRAQMKAVENALVVIGDNLLEGRDPSARLRLTVDRFVRHPDVKKALKANAKAQGKTWLVDEKELAVVANLVDNVTLAIKQYKNSSGKADLHLYQTLLGIAAPPPGANLTRAAARVFGLVSRSGLTLHAKRVAAAQVRTAKPGCWTR